MLAADLALLLLLLLCSAASAGIGMDDRRHPVPSVTVGAFRVKPEFPASRADPCRRLYVTLLPDGALPPGSRYLRLVVDSPGPLGAIAAPLQWAEIGTTQRLMVALSNFSKQKPAGAIYWAPSHFPPINGSVTVHAEAWSGRKLPPAWPNASADGTAPTLLGHSAQLELFFDFTFGSIQFLPPTVKDIGPGEGRIEFRPFPQDEARLAAQVEMFFFCRVGPVTNLTTGVINRTKGGRPIFQWCANQYQHPTNRFTVAWTQPGIYYIGLNGAWNGNTFHTVMLSPLNGIETRLYPYVEEEEEEEEEEDPAGRFQPLALIVPFANGSKPQLPAGFAGPSHVLPPIAGDKRVALTKRNLTFFHGAHFYIPLSAPAPSGGALFAGESWAATVALDVAGCCDIRH